MSPCWIVNSLPSIVESPTCSTDSSRVAMPPVALIQMRSDCSVRSSPKSMRAFCRASTPSTLPEASRAASTSDAVMTCLSSLPVRSSSTPPRVRTRCAFPSGEMSASRLPARSFHKNPPWRDSAVTSASIAIFVGLYVPAWRSARPACPRIHPDADLIITLPAIVAQFSFC